MPKTLQQSLVEWIAWRNRLTYLQLVIAVIGAVGGGDHYWVIWGEPAGRRVDREQHKKCSKYQHGTAISYNTITELTLIRNAKAKPD